MYSQEEREKKNEKYFFIIILIFFTLIIIIFLLIRCLGFIDHKPKIPTGNIDIFDIIFQQNCNNSCNCNSCNNSNCKNCTNYNNNNNSNINNCNNNINNISNINNSNGTTQLEEKSGLQVLDKETEYSHNTTLNIFTNTTYYIVNNKIAPLTENAYQFAIRNHNDFNIKYTLELNEENKYDINMKYRLKLNGVYVAGNNDKWITHDELNQYNIELSANTYDVYTLEWKWFESENDTEVGEKINSNFKLELKITASEY